LCREKRAPLLGACRVAGPKPCSSSRKKRKKSVRYYGRRWVGDGHAYEQITPWGTIESACSALGKLVLTAYGALLAFHSLVLLPVAYCLARIPLCRFLKFVAEPQRFDFPTSTSKRPCARALERRWKRDWRAAAKSWRRCIPPRAYKSVTNLDSFQLCDLILCAGTSTSNRANGGEGNSTGRGPGATIEWCYHAELTSKASPGCRRAFPWSCLATASTFHLLLHRTNLHHPGVDAADRMARHVESTVPWQQFLASAVFAPRKGTAGRS